uniref:HORMA domain-containing protein n=1 Tax=Wuchereria bancrofti TaxID=6293 RepID=A0AAF5PY68_WUCBA
MNKDGGETKSHRNGREMKLFPSSLDSRSSTLFMRRFLFIIVSDIIKKRLLIPTSAFKDIIIDGLKCCIVTEDTELGKKLSALLYAVSEAIEKHYLHDFFILISTDEADNMDEVVEAYTLTFTYADGGRLLFRSPSHEIALSCESVTELRKEAVVLLHRLDVLMNILSPVPQSAFPYFKLTYYASTPHGYEPAGFKPSSTTYRFKNMTFISKISAGTFSTKFESCSVCLESVFFGSANEHYEQNASTDRDEPKMLKGIIGETPKGRPKKDRLIKSKNMKYGGKTKEKMNKEIIEDENNGSELMNLRVSSQYKQMEVKDFVSQENSTEIIESIRASLLEDNSPNEPSETEKIILSCVEAVASTTDLQKSDFIPQHSGDSEDVPESSGQFATFGSPSDPYINSPRMDSTFSLPTVTELVSHEPVFKKGSSIGNSSSGNNATTEPDVARESFTEHSSSDEASSNAEPKAKKMKISRSKLDYHTVIYFRFII